MRIFCGLALALVVSMAAGGGASANVLLLAAGGGGGASWGYGGGVDATLSPDGHAGFGYVGGSGAGGVNGGGGAGGGQRGGGGGAGWLSNGADGDGSGGAQFAGGAGADFAGSAPFISIPGYGGFGGGGGGGFDGGGGGGGYSGGGGGGHVDGSGGGGGSYVSALLYDARGAAGVNESDGYVEIGSVAFAYSGEVVAYIVPVSGMYHFSAAGAAGGGESGRTSIDEIGYGGRGALLSGDIFLTAGTTLDIVVGGIGTRTVWYARDVDDGSLIYFDSSGFGGGGGSFVFIVGAPEPATWVLVAAGFIAVSLLGVVPTRRHAAEGRDRPQNSL